MPLTVTNTFTNGTTIDAAQMNTNFTDVKTFVDGLQTGTNIGTGAVTSAKIASGSVETAKIADAAVTAVKLAVGVSSDDQFVIGAQVFG